MEHAPHPGMSSVYHGRPPGIPWLIAFCENGWEYHDYYPHALDDIVVCAWALHTRDETIVYLPPDLTDVDIDDDVPAGTVETFRTLDDAHTHCTDKFDEPLHLVWL